MKGQALVEFALVMAIALGVAVGMGRWFMSSWQRAKCLHSLFLSTRRGLEGTTGMTPGEVRVVPGGVVGRRTCGDGGGTWEFFLPDLENWGRGER